MSAGELESDIAGKPGRMIRERYRRAADMGKVRAWVMRAWVMRARVCVCVCVCVCVHVCVRVCVFLGGNKVC